MVISDILPGNRARLVHFGQTPAAYRRQLLSLGVTRGVEILLIRRAPLGCPVQIEVRGTLLTLRQEEACHLQWELV
jgi:ferrous iron transport protein A